MPIRARLTVAVAITATLFMLVAGFAFVTVLQARLVGDIDQVLEHRLSSLLRPSVVNQLPYPQNNSSHGLSFLGPNGVSAIQLYGNSTSPLSSFSLYGSAVLLNQAQLLDAQKSPTFFTRTIAGYPHAVRVLAEPVPIVPGDVIAVAASLEGVDQATAQVAITLTILGGVLVGLATLSAWFFSGAALHPVERLRQQAAVLAKEGGGRLLDVPSTKDEIASLAQTMNEVLLRLRGALQSQREFVSDAGHELRTPLATLAVEVELALRPNRKEQDLREALLHVQEETSRLATLSENLLLLARSDEQGMQLHLQVQPLLPVLAAAVRTVKQLAKDAAVEIQMTCPESLQAAIDTPTLQRAVENLLDNAIRQSPKRSTVQLLADTTDETIQISVKDQGPGFPADFLPTAFDRFTRPDNARGRKGGGSGLGLAIVLTIARAHRGDAVITNAENGGAIVTITLPSRQAE